jgi:thiol-disulfide isomerase/thioredoxin
MTTTPTPDRSPVPEKPPDPIAGAFRFGLVWCGIILALGALGAAVKWGVRQEGEQALAILGHMAAFAAAAGVGLAVSRGLCALAGHPQGGSLGIFGLLAGVVLAGYLSGAKPTDSTEPRQGGEPGTMQIAGPTLDGQQFHLRDRRGKVVLVDFWATWCGPCVAELPTIREVYDKYHADGLEVVAVSLDNSRSDLERFLRDHPEPWPQIFFDKTGQRGWFNPLARRYGVEAIPHLVVIDREGKVAARDVRGAEIESAVAGALGLPAPQEDWPASAGRSVVGWFIGGIFQGPVLLLLACGAGGAVLLGAVEALARRMFTRRAAGPLTP